MFIYLFNSVIFANSLVGIYGTRKLTNIKYIQQITGFNNSLITALAFNHMLRHASETFYGSMSATISFFFLLLVEKYFIHIHNHISHASMWLNILGISIHAALAGLSLGSAENDTDMVYVFIAIISHKLFTTFTIAKKYEETFPVILFSFVTPLFAFIAYFSNMDTVKNYSVLEGLSAGTFLYLGLSELLIENTENTIVHLNKNPKHTIYMICSIVCGCILGTIISSPLVIKNDHGSHSGHNHLQFTNSTSQDDHDDHDDHDHT